MRLFERESGARGRGVRNRWHLSDCKQTVRASAQQQRASAQPSPSKIMSETGSHSSTGSCRRRTHAGLMHCSVTYNDYIPVCCQSTDESLNTSKYSPWYRTFRIPPRIVQPCSPLLQSRKGQKLQKSTKKQVFSSINCIDTLPLYLSLVVRVEGIVIHSHRTLF